MWKRLLNTEYFLLLEGDFYIHVTNYVSIWRYQFTKETFLECLKYSNEGLEMDDKELLQKGMQMLAKPEELKNAKCAVDELSNLLVVELTKSFGFPLWIEMNLPEGSRELYFKKVTLGLLITIEDLRKSQEELKELLQKKDMEIEEYKCEGGEIALRFLKTIPFNDESHSLKYQAYSKHFGSSDIPDCVLNKILDVPEDKRIQAELRCVNVKEEIETNSSQSLVKEESSIVIKTEEIPPKEELKPDFKKEDVKCEPLSQSSSSQNSVNSQISTNGPSPSKRIRKKLNL